MDPLVPGFPTVPIPLGAPPSVSSVTGVGTSGGTATANGANFVSLPKASVNIAGTPTTLGVSFTSSSQLVLTLAGGTYTAGAWDLTITNPDGQTVVAAGVFQITTATTPATIFGAGLRMQAIAGNAVTSGSTVVSVPDSTGNGNNVTVTNGTSTSTPADPLFFMKPTSIHMDGTSSALQCPSLDLGTGGTLYIFAAVAFLGTSGTQQMIANFNAPDTTSLFVGGGTNQFSVACASVSSVASPLSTGGPAIVVGGQLATVGNSISVNNGAVASNAASVSPSNLHAFTIGASFNGSTYSLFGNFAWCEVFVTNVKPTSTQLLQVAEYFNATYGVTAPPSFTAATPLKASTAGAALRVSGANFMANVTANAIVAGAQVALTTVSNTSTTIDLTTPSIAAGTYDLEIINVDGRQRTFVGALVVSSTVTPMSIFGLKAVGWFDPASVTGAPATVAALADLSLVGNDVAEATNQPVYLGVDASFNGQPSLTGNGTNTNLSRASFNMNGGTSCAILSVAKFGAFTGNRCVAGVASGTQMFLLSSTGKPVTHGAADATWGSTVAVAENLVSIGTAGGGGTGTYSINVANGTAVTTSSTVSFASGAGFTMFNAAGIQFSNASVGIVVVLNAVPSAPELAAWETYCQGRFAVP